MLFNSFQFALFFPAVVAVYFVLPHRFRWLWLLAASCGFYMAFIPVYILILGFTIVVDYFAGILIENEEGMRRKAFLVMSLVANIGVLAVFKYFNFVNSNLASLAAALHWQYPIRNLGILLPIGLSFHTFQAMSYTIEVYRGNQKAERHFGIYALYVMFFPQLVAGPIERPQNLLHQFWEQHDFDYGRVTAGLKRMMWGFFKKVVIADRLADMVNTVYADPNAHSPIAVILATYFFAFQIYCDFSGYSDIALGSAEVLGFKLMTNFNRPYFSKSIAEFWKRWHISLSTWFKDYLYIPLGGNRTSKPRWLLNLLIVFLVSGLWHGANWTFIVWGALHGSYLIAGVLTHNARECVWRAIGVRREHSTARRIVGALITFHLVAFAWIFFRASDLAHANAIIQQIFAVGGRASIDLPWSPLTLSIAIGVILLLLSAQIFARSRNVLETLSRGKWYVRWAVYYGVVVLFLLLSRAEAGQFIYFQF